MSLLVLFIAVFKRLDVADSKQGNQSFGIRGSRPRHCLGQTFNGLGNLMDVVQRKIFLIP